MTPPLNGMWSNHWKRKMQHLLYFIAVYIACVPRTVLCCANCKLVLTSPSGAFTSPCYPEMYPNSQDCIWTIRAPVGFIIQVTFLDFDIEEAQNCMYDSLSINNGETVSKFCGITAKGLSFNSAGNVMIITFGSDFSIQKKGFSATYNIVAVSLRNQKVTIPQNQSSGVVTVSSKVSVPPLTQLTVCFEATETNSSEENWRAFSYQTSNRDLLSFGKDTHGHVLSVLGVPCILDPALLSHGGKEFFTESFQQLCIIWNNRSEQVFVSTKNNYQAVSCPDAKDLTIPGNGNLTLGSYLTGTVPLQGDIYNFRLWDFAMDSSTVANLSCEDKGNIINWENDFWNIPSWARKAESKLSCGTSLPTTPSTEPTTCEKLAGVCQASTVASTITSSTQTSTVLISSSPSPAVTSPSTVATSPDKSTISSTTAIANSPDFHAYSTIYATVTPSLPPALITTNITTYNPLPATVTASPSTMITTNMTTNSTDNPESGGTFYRISITVVSDADNDELKVQSLVSSWLNVTFRNWNYTVFVVNISITPVNASSVRKARDVQAVVNSSYYVWALLVYNNSNNVVLEKDDILKKINGSPPSGLTLQAVDVFPVELCEQQQYPPSYFWPPTKPTTTAVIPCSKNSQYTASRTCNLGLHNYTSYWDAPDLKNCTDNAEDLANQLLNLTGSGQVLTQEKVDDVVQTLKKIVNDANINSELGSTVVNVFSNILSGSDNVLAKSSSEALKTIDALALKIQFSGPSVSIVSPNLCLGVSRVNATSYSGSSFSVGAQSNSSHFEIDMKKNQDNPFASVVLPSSLLSNLSQSDFYTVSRAQFTFFSKAGLFQDSQLNAANKQKLNSYVVACSIGNISIHGLADPVKITVKHQKSQENGDPTCVYWDINKNAGSGGWSQDGCSVLINESNAIETVCLCNHLTHFGILMDLQRGSDSFDPQNTKILTFITYIGCGISAICTAATLLTYIAFEKIRRDYPSKILMNLSTALLFLNLFFLLDGWLASFEINELCIAVAALLHFFLLATFTWMGLEAVHMYIALVKVFNTYIRRYILKFCIIGWGIPAIVVAIVLASTYKDSAYGRSLYGKDTDGNGDAFCWIKNNTVFYVTCVAYFGIMFLMNVAMFIVVMVQICGRNGKRTNRSIREEVLRNMRSVVSLTFLLGMTWGFAFFAWGKATLAFMYLFTIFNSLQGLFIFVFHCALKENVQKQWRRHLCCGKLRLPDNSDWSKTATNNTKKVSSDNLGKSLSSSSIGSNSTYWTSKSKSSSNPFFNKRNSSTGYIFGDRPSVKFTPVDGEQTSILPVHHVIDKVKGYCHPHSDNFYKNIIMSDTFNHSTKF
ncbi:adhesion G-protein coupled receptor G6 isoform X2 [Bufo gargarizans]|uniref:adhesion G-protein coupled receptor G6 isoform X2 n=1 Tax=Bufo gargarizans TaxID=30331 RepID=UPI001CF2B820|nr:adhesion G-protein coupled receptor G6 isoform X2 [Bufo gargarizans]